MGMVMGIDPSFTGTGLILLDDKTAEVLHCQLIKTNAKNTLPQRVKQVLKAVQDVGMNDIRVVSIEGFSYGSMGNAMISMGYLGYRIREMLEEFKLPFIEPAPSQVKKYATGKGNCGKDLILQQVYKRWGVEFTDNNLADAYVLAQIGRGYLGEDLTLIKAQCEVIDALRKAA